ncbi:MAG TPA: hypothetical protein VFV92_14110 [Candidatus Bathyarchaeia archaeon]|nr:hypothetical protein [Candidatus Bathyarchaeia archaeon]
MPVKADAQQATDKWLQNIGTATERMKQGAMNVTVAPGQKAAAAADKWLQRVQQAQAKYKNNVSRVSLQDWQQAYIQVGIPRVSQGAQAKKAKYTAAMADFLPYLIQGVAKIDAMPKTTLQDSIARAVAMINHNAAYVRPKA